MCIFLCECECERTGSDDLERERVDVVVLVGGTAGVAVQEVVAAVLLDAVRDAGTDEQADEGADGEHSVEGAEPKLFATMGGRLELRCVCVCERERE